jgi:methylenetetrahydrofolate dehydrogenase (NADP+)/methenyltetrahydrofolate cyclohydrolase
MDPRKDADGFHPTNLQAFLNGEPATTPGVAAGIMKLIELSGQPLQGKTATLVVNSMEFAEPLIKLLSESGVATTITREPDTGLTTSDIIVIAVGKPGILKSSHVKDGAIVIDVGTTKVAGHVVGDADPELKARDIYLTPVPGGVGPMTVAMLLWNVYELHPKKLLA